MRIIIEGPDGVGKSTLVRKLADHFKCDILVMTELGSKTRSDYISKSYLDNIISDRSFISEIVYASVFDREAGIKGYDFDDVMRYYHDYDWTILVLDCDTEIIRKRLHKRGDESPEKIANIEDLRITYRGIARFYDLPIIDTENLDVEKLIKDLEDGKYAPHNRR